MTFGSRHIPDHLYFITATIWGWKPLFLKPEYAEIVLNSLAWLRQEKRMSLYAFALMSTHLHTTVLPRDRSIGELLQNFGSFTAHKILRTLKDNNEKELLAFFHSQRLDNREEHGIWQDIQAKNIDSEKFLAQKMEYIHQNPVAKDSDASQDRAAYLYSSACFYDKNQRPIIEIDDFREIL